MMDFMSKVVFSDEPHKEEKKGWTKLLILAGITTTFGSSLPVGYNIGVVNAPADIIKNFCNESMYTRYGAVLSDAQMEFLWSAIVSIFLVGGSIGSLTGSWLADNVGRKGAIVASTVLLMVAGVLFMITQVSNSVETLIAGRLLAGLAAGLVTCTIPMYLTELAPLELRGSMGVLCPLGINCGIFLGQIISLRQILGTEEFWPYLLGFYTISVVLSAVAIPFLPESPKYLLFVKKQPEQAFRQLVKIRGVPEKLLTDEIQEMQLASQQTDDEDDVWNILRVLTDSSLLLPLLLVMFLQAGQQFSGINAVFYYSVSIFKTAGLDELNSQLASIGAGSINLLMAIISIPLMAKCNRRSVLQLSCFTASFCLLILGLTITYIDLFSWMPYLCILAVLSFVLFYGVGLGPIPYFIGSELFEVGPRPSAMALGSMANWGGNFIVGMSFPSLQTAIGPGSFLIFALITLALFVFIRIYLPETKNRDPGDIALLCKHGLRSRVLDTASQSSDTVVTVPTDDNSV
ncbi:solute carrier family 2, facilitated glucose transporter member 1 isoform X2 [Agrilus planipennis]|uniref:Solute carrier family 2, facilitated glucose transporter member 1 isoform X2 n=1 Tax=Agrilus planipennis TaxID=224129 RepID=A0A7F5RMV9_AGRPL|nr:solute carrier family 2, facilitated glucose transporter member 1 isoform X2 [Agrilus planipennis]